MAQRDEIVRPPLFPPTSSGAQIIQAAITAAAPTVWYDYVEGVSVYATVVEICCPVCDVAVGDTVVIWDPRSCYFDLPIEALIGAIATAFKADVPEDMNGYDDWLGTPCRWVASGVSCCEEIYGCN